MLYILCLQKKLCSAAWIPFIISQLQAKYKLGSRSKILVPENIYVDKIWCETTLFPHDWARGVALCNLR